MRYTDRNISGFLPAYRFTPSRAKGTIVFFGGFVFEGPDSGSALDEAGLARTADWHKPVAAVLDHFAFERVTRVGLSLGGCLVMRAAALEP